LQERGAADKSRRAAESTGSAVLLAACASVAFGLAEVLLHDRAGAVLEPTRGVLSLLVVGGVYLAFGVAVGLASAVITRERVRARALGSVAGALVAAWVLGWMDWGLSSCVVAVAAGLSIRRAISAIGAMLPTPVLSTPLYALAALAVLGVCIMRVSVPPSQPEPTVSPAKGPSILLFTIDTLRADAVGIYGAQDAHTPNLDALGRDGAVFREAVSHSFLTNPSHTTILTGLLPKTHGSTANGSQIRDEIETVAEVLEAQGYATAAFIGGYTVTEGSSGLPSRFQYYDDEMTYGEGKLPNALKRLVLLRAIDNLRGLPWVGRSMYRPAEYTVQRAIDWLTEPRDRPVFLWVHSYDPHLPYRPPSQHVHGDAQYAGGVTGDWYKLTPGEKARVIESPVDLQRMKDLYNAEISYADHELGRLRGAISANVKGDVLTIVTSDHGENMGERSSYWGRDLHDSTIMVPLIMAGPGVPASRTVTEQVRLVDLVPTTLELTGLPPLPNLDGESLVPLMQGTNMTVPGPALSYAYSHTLRYTRPAISVREAGWKLIRHDTGWGDADVLEYAGQSFELFSLYEDPDEERNRYDAEPVRAQALATHLAEERSTNDRRKPDLDEEAKLHLRALGYID
jgi:arylsulfatase A-like enzyme